MNHTTRLALAVSLGAAQQAVASGFIDDSKASLDLRNFYYNQDTRNAKAPTDKEWGQAFMFNYQSGFTEGTVGLGVDVQQWYGLRLDASGRSGKKGEDITPGSVFPLDDGKAAQDFSKTGVTGKMRIAQTQCMAVQDWEGVHHGGQHYLMGVSIGLLVLDAGRYTVSSAMRAADRACYAAKRKGRNRVEVLADAMD